MGRFYEIPEDIDKYQNIVLNKPITFLDVAKMLEEFSRTRSISLAVDICDAMNDLITLDNE